jgi:tetratricopeptide (TPR) repeat protein
MKRVEAAIDREKWVEARVLIRAGLRTAPEDHWLLTRLALTYYEERQYKRALRYVEKALAEAPRCPLVLWDHAGTLQMLGRHTEAVAVYRRLIRRGVDKIAFGDCGEGLLWAKSLLTDCLYRISISQRALGRRKLAIQSIEKHLASRGPGCRSIYPIRSIRRELALLKSEVAA